MKRVIDGKPTTLTLPRSDYTVGYGKPPEGSRFTKGQSGNPKGRPKGAKQKANPNHYPAFVERLQAIVLEEAYRVISVRDGLREVKVPMAQAIVRALAVNAVKGQQRAQRLFTELLTTTEREKHRRQSETLEIMFDYKRKWDQELERRRSLGLELPEPVPHPDHIRIDLRTGSYEISGPLTKEEKADLEVWRRHKLLFEETNRGLGDLLIEGHDVWSPEDIQEQIRGNQQCIEFINTMLRNGRPWPLSILPDDVDA